jgi:hypothetical protein
MPVALGVAHNARADALPEGTVLSIKPGTDFSPGNGSYFLMGGDDGALLKPGTGPGLILGRTTENGEGTRTSEKVVESWTYFGNQGYNRIETGQLSNGEKPQNPTPPADNGDGTLNMGGWVVHWNGDDIDMSGGSAADFQCESGPDGCQVGDTYSLDYHAVVPGGSFNGVEYDLHLEGTIKEPAQSTAGLPKGTVLTVDKGDAYQTGSGSWFEIAGIPGALLAPGQNGGLTLGATERNGEGDPQSTLVVDQWDFLTLAGYNRIDTQEADAGKTPSVTKEGFNMGAWMVNLGSHDFDASQPYSVYFRCDSGAPNCKDGDHYTLDYKVNLTRLPETIFSQVPPTDLLKVLDKVSGLLEFEGGGLVGDYDQPLEKLGFNDLVPQDRQLIEDLLKVLDPQGVIPALADQGRLEEFKNAAPEKREAMVKEVLESSGDSGGLLEPITGTLEGLLATLGGLVDTLLGSDSGLLGLLEQEALDPDQLDLLKDLGPGVVSLLDPETLLDPSSLLDPNNLLKLMAPLEKAGVFQLVDQLEEVTTAETPKYHLHLEGTVQLAPVAVNDQFTLLENESADLDVLTNDQNRQRISPSTVTVAEAPEHGQAQVNGDGSITYTPEQDYTGADTFTYTFGRNGGSAAFVDLTVAAKDDGSSGGNEDNGGNGGSGGSPGNPGAVTGATILELESGVRKAADSGTKPSDGSYFGMEVQDGDWIYTVLKPGPAEGIILGSSQSASGSHSGSPDGSERPGIDEPWKFFGNTGMHLSAKPVAPVEEGDNSMQLDFSGWAVTWNGIDRIDMGSGAHGSNPDGIAEVSCDPDCESGSDFTLEYTATVPNGDPSGFGGVSYQLHLEGEIGGLGSAVSGNGNGSLELGSYASSVGDSMRMSQEQLINAGVRQDEGMADMCVGGCFDFKISDLEEDTASVVLKLTQGIPANAAYRKFMNGSWTDFDTSSGDGIASAPANGGVCPGLDQDSAYSEGLNQGDVCVRLTLTDNGPNDADPTAGTIADPSGVSATQESEFTDDRSSGSSGCSMTTAPVDPWQRAEWLILAGFLIAWGWKRRRQTRW